MEKKDFVAGVLLYVRRFPALVRAIYLPTVHDLRSSGSIVYASQ